MNATPDRPPMPLLLRLGLWLSVLLAALFVLALVLLAIVLPLNDAFPLGDRTVSRAEFLAATWPTLSILPVTTAFVVAIAVGVWRERAWARPVMLVYTVVSIAWVTVVGVLAHQPVATSLVIEGALAAFTGWYLYAKRSVVTYYDALKARERGDTA